MKSYKFVVVILVLGSILTVSSLVSREPVHEGKALSEWLVDLSSMDPPTFRRAEEAVMALGTQCLPVLRRCLQNRDSSLGIHLLQAGDELGIPCPPTAESWHSPALQACRVLGPAAAPLIPEIVRFLDGCRQVEAVKVLVATGQASIPAVIPMLTDTNIDVRVGAAAVLGTLAQHSETAVPALLPLLSDECAQVRMVASWALGRFSAQADLAPPQLELAARDPIPEVRSQDRSARRRIHVAETDEDSRRGSP